MHEGHRERMREKYLKNGAQAFLPHEILEMLLFFAIPRVNTNEIAHELLSKFKSVQGILDADLQELKSVKGIGDQVAMLLSLVSEVRRLSLQPSQKDIRRFDKLSVARDFGIEMLRGHNKEQLCALLLDNQLKKVDFVYLTQGAVNHVPFDLVELYGYCLRPSVSAVILYHNHPNGLAVPSREDINLTYQIESKLADINRCLLEHFVVSDHACMPILYAQGVSFQHLLSKPNLERQTVEDFYNN